MKTAGGINGKASRRSQAQCSNWWGRLWQRKVQKRARVIGNEAASGCAEAEEDGEGKGRTAISVFARPPKRNIAEAQY